MLTLFVTAVGLSMDAVAVSVSNGMCYQMSKRTGLLMAFYFGAAQALMPLLGFFLGSLFQGPIESVDHWVALLVLSFLGGKMIWETVKKEPEGDQTEGKELTNKLLAVQAVATSIDALAVGISFALMRVQIVSAVLIIGLTTFCCCLLAVLLGQKFGGLLQRKAGLFGGVLLIGIGLKIFVEHMLGG